MPPPAADAPCPEQAFNATALKWHTCAWLLLPVLVFLTGWMHWYAALPLTLLTAAGLTPRESKEPQTRDSLPAFPLFTRSSFLALAAFAALMALSGWGSGSTSTLTISSEMPVCVNWSPVRGLSSFRTGTC